MFSLILDLYNVLQPIKKLTSFTKFNKKQQILKQNQINLI